jgi:diamine N-acetyltransferase
MPVRLATVSSRNVVQACNLQIRPDQERYVAPVSFSLAQAYVYGDQAWPRLVYDDDDLVGFVMAGFVDGDPLLHSTLWRLNIASSAQNRGYGRFAVRAAAEEARRRGRRELAVGYARGEGSPEGFYSKLGFIPTGKQIDEFFEAVAPLDALINGGRAGPASS